VRQTRQTAQRQAKATGRVAQREADTVLQLVRGEAEGLTNEARRQADRLAGVALEKLNEQRETQTQRLASGMRSAGGQAQALAQGDLDSAGMLGYYAQAIGERLEAVAEDLEQRGPAAVLADLDRFAEARPGAFLLGMCAAGFALGRLLRANGREPAPVTRRTTAPTRSRTTTAGSQSGPARSSTGHRPAAGRSGRTGTNG
jgi:hypothetical protein